ncbi:DUF3987 domain-containing protein [Rubrobacter indicoceani]|uniref:phage NrS-1 polymerase family protein n=1 Tax=Rubrobacter indicoceani TaxID=2051957 RepID=UPI000E5BBC05|nr:DUF3987 domain-containing protein [Rubrobacter indicoceani]
MKDFAQWICWRYEDRSGGKKTKVPYSPTTGRRARTDDPSTWTTLSEVRRAAPDYDGVGFVFTEQDPFLGVDLDSCVNPDTGEVGSWAREIVDDLDSYTELSPSGTGIHIIVRATLPGGGNRKGRIELYDRGRFFTVTGDRLPGTPARTEARQREIDRLHRKLFPPEPPRNGHAPNGLSDDEILRRAISSANGNRFIRLWEGDRTGYASDSEADLALVSMLAFWCGPDEERIEDLFSRSNLVRDKWNRKDYRRRTIARALSGTSEFYSCSANDTRQLAVGSPPPLSQTVEFPTDAMPASCRPLISESEAALGCAPELVALPMLATLSSAIGTSRIIQIKGGWREYAALFVAVVASPGAMKTPAAKLARKPAFERQRGFGKNYAEGKEVWKQEVREWEVEQRTARKNSEPAPEEPTPPTMERSVASDTTVEALVSILEDNPRGLLVYKDELSGWVRSMDQYKGGKGSDRQHWLSFWSGDEVVVDRKSRQGEPIIVAKPFVSLFGGIQPAMLSELGAGSEDGLTDRFLFAYPESRQIRFTDHEVSQEAEQKYATLYESLAVLTLATDENGDPKPKPLRLTTGAKRVFASEINALGAEAMEPGFPARLEGVWAKLRGYLARLSLLLAVCRNPEANCIEVEDVEAAARLLMYFKVHAKRVYEELSSPDPLDVLGAYLKELIETAGGRLEITATELHRELEDTGCEALPERPKELSQAIRKLATRSAALQVGFGWRGKEKVIRLELKVLQENSVGRVGSVGNEDTSTNATYATNADSEKESPKNAVGAVVTVDPEADYRARDDETNGKSEREQPGDHASANATYATNANCGNGRVDSEGGEDRVGFTI